VNYLAILSVVSVIFILGGLWYSVIFKNLWISLMGIPKKR